MSVWMVCPSKRPVEVVAEWVAAWRKQGYRIAIWRDPLEAMQHSCADVEIAQSYPGYAQAVNNLALGVLRQDSKCNWIVTGGDDVFPDPNHTADEIARECSDYFHGLHAGNWVVIGGVKPNFATLATFGVMQPTGDRFGEQPGLPEGHPMRGAYSDRVCGSPWMGREFCLRINQGRGPLWPEYTHMFEDEELQAVALKYGVLWQRPDLTHYHKHWARGEGGKPGNSTDMPEFLKSVNTPEHWRKYKALFESRKAAGFPGSEPL